MSTVAGSTTSSPQSQFLGSLNEDQKKKFDAGKDSAKQLHDAFNGDKDGAKKQQDFSDALKEKDPMKKMMALKKFQDELSPEEKDAFKQLKDKREDFQKSLNKDQHKQEHDIAKDLCENGKASVGGVFDFSS